MISDKIKLPQSSSLATRRMLTALGSKTDGNLTKSACSHTARPHQAGKEDKIEQGRYLYLQLY